MNLVTEINRELWESFESSKYKNVEFYIKKWHEGNGYNENFSIIYKKDEENIDLLSTLHNIDGETLLKIAIDLGIETPDFIPAIPTFRNEIKANYENASLTFEKAFKLIEESPETAIGLANSVLESINKEILKSEHIKAEFNSNKTLYDLTKEILKEFNLFPNNDMPAEIKQIGSSLLSINQSIEKLRSNNTDFHGKTAEDYMVKDSLYAYFVVNSVTTIGLFMKSFFENKFAPIQKEQEDYTDIDELPF